MKHCSKCMSKNIDKALFCRHCGSKLIRNCPSINVLERYPEMNFVPTNFYDWRKPRVGMVLKFLLRVLTIIFLSFSIYMMYSLENYNEDWESYNDRDSGIEEHYCYIKDPFELFCRNWCVVFYVDGKFCSSYERVEDDYGSISYKPSGEIYEERSWGDFKARKRYRQEAFYFIGLFFSISLALFLLTYIICGYPKRPKDMEPLSRYADYVQKYSYWGIFRRRKAPKFVLFVKDGLFGILDVAHYKIFLPARYDYLDWREYGKYLDASFDDRNFLIDIHGNKLK